MANWGCTSRCHTHPPPLFACNSVRLSVYSITSSCVTLMERDTFRLVMQLSVPNPLKPGVKWRMKMQVEKPQQAMLQLHLSDKQVNCLLRCSYNRGWRYLTYLIILLHCTNLPNLQGWSAQSPGWLIGCWIWDQWNYFGQVTESFRWI